MILIRVVAIIGLAAFIQTALSAESLKDFQKVQQVVELVNTKYSAFLELCENVHVSNGLNNPKALSSREKIALFMELFSVVNGVQALDFVDIVQDIKQVSKALHKAVKLELADQKEILGKALKNLKLYNKFARLYSGSYRFMYIAARIGIAAHKELPLFKDELEIAPAKTVALAHQKNIKERFPILSYVKQLDKDLARLYKIQRRALKDSVREYVKHATVQGEILQNEIVKTSDYAIESRMHDLEHPRNAHPVLTVLGAIVVVQFVISLVFGFFGALL